MKILYLDLGMGAAGDMLAGALLGLLDEKARAETLETLNAALPAGVAATCERAAQHGLAGWKFTVTVDGAEETPHPSPAAEETDCHGPSGLAMTGTGTHHAHRDLADIEGIVAGMGLDEAVAAQVLEVYRAIAAAEGEAHGAPAELVHFHELGALDAVADVTASALALRALGAARVAASPVALGGGTVRCAHGVLPVPAPATALLLRGVPAYAGPVESELCTPTGAALVHMFVQDFGAMPCMAAQRVGYGFGTKAFPERPNCVRAILGEAEETDGEKTRRADGHGLAPYGAEAKEADTPHQSPAATASPQGEAKEEVIEFSCNLDDMTPEDIGFALERIFAAGALDAWTVAAGMKKNRPGVVLTALCTEQARADVLETMLAHTTTLGVREQTLRRHVLPRELETVQTDFGPVRRKVARIYGAEKAKWEYEDVARIAREQGMTLAEVRAVLDADGYSD